MAAQVPGLGGAAKIWTCTGIIAKHITTVARTRNKPVGRLSQRHVRRCRMPCTTTAIITEATGAT